jgi:hypothetical protein
MDFNRCWFFLGVGLDASDGRIVQPKTAPKPENKNCSHFRPISGQGSALMVFYGYTNGIVLFNVGG